MFHLILVALNTTSLVTMGSVCLMVSSVINMMTVGMAVTKKTAVYTIVILVAQHYDVRNYYTL